MPTHRIQLAHGARYGKLLLLEDLGIGPRGYSISKVLCDCGKRFNARNSLLLAGSKTCCAACFPRVTRKMPRHWSRRPQNPKGAGRAVVRCRCGDVMFSDQRGSHACAVAAVGGGR